MYDTRTWYPGKVPGTGTVEQARKHAQQARTHPSAFRSKRLTVV